MTRFRRRRGITLKRLLIPASTGAPHFHLLPLQKAREVWQVVESRQIQVSTVADKQKPLSEIMPKIPPLSVPDQSTVDCWERLLGGVLSSRKTCLYFLPRCRWRSTRTLTHTHTHTDREKDSQIKKNSRVGNPRW